ncbi:hypothetical protein P5W99_35550 [Paraburkholderia sp. A3BS-1L]|uniref:hypothetical protein n=1 Tax=Paraburkholderia sp. A3BS-1L TaxID=3028375 RepID=UPI003DA9A8C0
MNQLVVPALKKRRVDGDDGPHSLDGEAGRERNSILFRDCSYGAITRPSIWSGESPAYCHHANHRDIDRIKNISRCTKRRKNADDQDKHGQHNEGIRPFQRNAHDANHDNSSIEAGIAP